MIPPLLDGGPADVVTRGGPSGCTGRSRVFSCWRLVLPIALNPLVNELQPIVERLFPISSTIKDGARPVDGPGAEPRTLPSSSSR